MKLGILEVKTILSKVIGFQHRFSSLQSTPPPSCFIFLSKLPDQLVVIRSRNMWQMALCHHSAHVLFTLWLEFEFFAKSLTQVCLFFLFTDRRCLHIAESEIYGSFMAICLTNFPSTCKWTILGLILAVPGWENITGICFDKTWWSTQLDQRFPW